MRFHIREDVQKKIYSHVEKDLAPSYFSVLWRLGISLCVGGLLSVRLCDGVSMAVGARSLEHVVHHHMGDFACALSCGMIFALVPIISLRVLCSGVLFKKIIYEYDLALCSMMALCACVTYLTSNLMNDFFLIGLWFLGAFATFFWGARSLLKCQVSFKFE